MNPGPQFDIRPVSRGDLGLVGEGVRPNHVEVGAAIADMPEVGHRDLSGKRADGRAGLGAEPYEAVSRHLDVERYHAAAGFQAVRDMVPY